MTLSAAERERALRFVAEVRRILEEEQHVPKHMKRHMNDGHCCFSGCTIQECGCCANMTFHTCGVTDHYWPPQHMKKEADEICSKCGGWGCEEGCGPRGGCAWVYAGPDSHKVCSACGGSGKRFFATVDKGLTK